MSDFKISNNDKNIVKMFKKNDIITLYIILVAIFIGLVIASIIAFYRFHKTSNSIQPGVFIKGTNISGLTKEKAVAVVKENLKSQMNDNIILIYKNNEYYVAVEQIEAEFDIESSVEFAYNIARSGNFFKDMQVYTSILISNINIDPILKYSEYELAKYIETIQANLPDQLQQSGFYIDDDEVVLTTGANGAGIYSDELKVEIIEAIQDISYNRRIIDIPTYVQYPDELDVDAIHEDIYRQAENAYFTTEPYAVYSHIVGVDFDVENLKNRINEGGKDEYTAKLKYTIPEVTVNDIGKEAFPHLLGSFSTSHVNNADRTTNLRLASNKINGTVVMPGEIFSYNKVVGKRTIDAGYKEAPVYANGQVVDGLRRWYLSNIKYTIQCSNFCKS